MVKSQSYRISVLYLVPRDCGLNVMMAPMISIPKTMASISHTFSVCHTLSVNGFTTCFAAHLRLRLFTICATYVCMKGSAHVHILHYFNHSGVNRDFFLLPSYSQMFSF